MYHLSFGLYIKGGTWNSKHLSSKMPKKRPDAHNHWDVHLCETCFVVPGKWLTAFFCPPCVAFMQRKEILNNDMSQYECCAGMFCSFKPLTDPCPHFCLAMESCLCFWCAVSANRGMIQDTYDLENTLCEECMIWGACLFACFWCIFRMFVDVPVEADWAVDCGYLALSACFQSQQQQELQFQKTGVSCKGGPSPTTMEK